MVKLRTKGMKAVAERMLAGMLTKLGDGAVLPKNVRHAESGFLRYVWPSPSERGPHREPKRIQNAIIAAAGEKRMRRRQRPQGSTS